MKQEVSGTACEGSQKRSQFKDAKCEAFRSDFSRNCNFQSLKLYRSRLAYRAWNYDCRVCGLRNHSFSWRFTFQPTLSGRPHRRPVPSTSFSCRAWFHRRRSTFFALTFRPNEAAVQKHPSHFQQTPAIERSQQCAPHIEPHSMLPTTLIDAASGWGTLAHWLIRDACNQTGNQLVA